MCGEPIRRASIESESSQRELRLPVHAQVESHLKTADDLLDPLGGGCIVEVHFSSVSFEVTIRRMQWIVLPSEVIGG